MNWTAAVVTFSFSILALMLGAPMRGAQGATDKDKYAPLPDQIVNAKTVFLIMKLGKLSSATRSINS